MKISQIFSITFKIFGLILISSIVIAFFLASRPYYQANQVKIGMTKTQVLDIHASRINHIETRPNIDEFCQYNLNKPVSAFINGCKQKERQQSAYFLIVNIGIDTRQIIGFDNNDTVIFEMMGDT